MSEPCTLVLIYPPNFEKYIWAGHKLWECTDCEYHNGQIWEETYAQVNRPSPSHLPDPLIGCHFGSGSEIFKYTKVIENTASSRRGGAGEWTLPDLWKRRWWAGMTARGLIESLLFWRLFEILPFISLSTHECPRQDSGMLTYIKELVLKYLDRGRTRILNVGIRNTSWHS